MQTVDIPSAQPALDKMISQVTKKCLTHLERYDGVGLYALIMETIEPALFTTVLEACRYNQSQAARILGLARGTFRERLRQYFGDIYFGRRSEKINDDDV